MTNMTYSRNPGRNSQNLIAMLQQCRFFVRKEVSASLEETDKTLQSIDRLFTPDFDTIRLLLQGGTVFAAGSCKENK